MPEPEEVSEEALEEAPEEAADKEEPTTPPVVAALSAALSARWLPTTVPWEPDPEWQQLELPKVPMPPAAFSTVMRLIHVRVMILLALKLDPLKPEHQAQLARVVATLNLRSELLEPLAQDPRPWSALARLNDHLDIILQADAAKLLEPEEVEPLPLAPWRPLLTQLTPLLPVIAVVEMLKLDLSDPVAALKILTVTIRILRRVVLPPLEQPHLIMQLIARNEAVKRLEASLGPAPFAETRAKVEEKLKKVQEQLPPGLSVGPTGLLEGLPHLSPNPSLVINAPTVIAARQLNKAFVAGLNWNISIHLDIPLLTTGAPVAALVKAGIGPVRSSPCDRDCDAARALATAWRGSETGAAPAA